VFVFVIILVIIFFFFDIFALIRCKSSCCSICGKHASSAKRANTSGNSLVVPGLFTIRGRPGRHWLSVEDAVELQLQVRKRIFVDVSKALGLYVVLD
jgi:hypothetical protein